MTLPYLDPGHQQERINKLRSMFPATTERRIAIRSFIQRAAARWIKAGPILDIGAGYRSAEPEVCAKHLMPYYTVDKDGSKDADFVIDAHNLCLFKEGTFEAVLLIEVLEHVEFPMLVMREASRVLRSNGVLLLTAPFAVPLHPKDTYGDFWRFSPEGIRLLARESQLEVLELDTVGPMTEPLSIRVVAIKNKDCSHNYRIQPTP